MRIKLLSLSVMLLALILTYSCQKAPVVPAYMVKAIAGVDSSSINLPHDSVNLLGQAGPGDHITGYLWSQISGPNEAIINNESSKNTYAKGLITGHYIFQFLVIDKSGSSATDTVGVTVKYTPPVTPKPPVTPNFVTLDLSPNNNPFEIALSVIGNTDATNKSSIEEPLAAWTIGGVPITVRELLKFDLSSIPANATISSANLQLFSDTIPKNGDLIDANYGADNSFVVQQVAASWDVASVNWFNQPSGLTNNQVVVPTTTSSFLNLDINVTSLVAAMVNNNQNYGFKLSLQNEVQYTSRIFCSSYYSVASRHPHLIVKYTVH